MGGHTRRGILAAALALLVAVATVAPARAEETIGLPTLEEVAVASGGVPSAPAWEPGGIALRAQADCDGTRQAFLEVVGEQEVRSYKGDYDNDVVYNGWNGEAWCGHFIAWCAREAGVSTDYIPSADTAKSVPRFASWFGSDYHSSGSDYDPKAGDIAFFTVSGNANWHVGVVVGRSGSDVVVKEGNVGNGGANDEVQENIYSKSGGRICGYGETHMPEREPEDPRPGRPDWSEYYGNGNAWPYGDVAYVIRSAIDPAYCIEVPNASTDNNARVYLHERNPYPQHECQQWVFRYNYEREDSSYSIFNRYSGKALEVLGASWDNRAWLGQYEFNGSDAQRWYIHDCGDGTVAFQNKESGLWLDIKPDAAYDGAPIQQYVFVSTDNPSQKFYLTPFYDKNYDGETTIPQDVLDGQYFYFHSMQNQNLVLDIHGASADNGAALELYGITTGENQQFKFVAQPDGSYGLVARHSDKAIEMPNISVRLGEPLHQWNSPGVPRRHWFVRQAGAQNVIALRNVWTDLYMHVRDDDAHSGATVEQNRYNNNDSERFVIVPVPDDSAALELEEGVYEIVSAQDESLAVTIDGAGAGSEMRLAANEHAASQRFRVTRDGKRHYFEAVDGGKRIAIRGGNRISGTPACLAGPEDANVQRWFFDDAGDGCVLMRNGKTDLHLAAEGGQAAEGARVVERLNTGDADMRFRLRRLDVADAEVAPIADVPYTGAEATPRPEVTFGGAALAEGTDYTLEYSGNAGPGEATVTIVGAGDFCGSKTVGFSIVSYDRDGWVTLAGGAKGYAKGGKLVTGWMDKGSSKYWFDEQGRMATGWTDVDVAGKTFHYYFNPASGNLARGTWMTIDGKKYYFRPSGNMATGFADIDDNGVTKKYYFDGDGQMLTGWQEIEVNSKLMRYYFRPAGSMATGWATIDGQKYFFRDSGNMATGWATMADGTKRYFREDGTMHVGWLELGGKTYYLRDPSGSMVTGKATIDGVEFEFSKSGTLVGGAMSAQSDGGVGDAGEQEQRVVDEDEEPEADAIVAAEDPEDDPGAEEILPDGEDGKPM